MSVKFNVIKALREERKYSREELAIFLGIPEVILEGYEEGVGYFSSDLIRKLSEVFGVNAKCFIENKMPAEIVIEDTDMRIDTPIEDTNKFKQVLLYVLNKVGAKVNVGKTVIYKLLYFIDFDYYELYETQLMGLKYKRDIYGPCSY